MYVWLAADKLKTSSTIKVLNGKTRAVNIIKITGAGLIQTHFIYLCLCVCKGEHDTSVTINKLLSNEKDNETVNISQTQLSKNDLFFISHDSTKALSHMHPKGFWHCDLKTNSILVSNKLKFLMVLLEAKPVTYSPLVKYSIRWGSKMTFHFWLPLVKNAWIQTLQGDQQQYVLWQHWLLW